MKDMVRLIVTLTLICAACSSLLAFVSKITEEPIRQSAILRKLDAAKKVMPPACEAPVEKTYETNFVYYVASKDGKPAAYALEGTSQNGYGGTVRLMVGFSADKKLTNFEVIEAKETPGLGMKMATEEFRAPMRDRAVDTEWRVKKDGGEIAEITAATISSRAVMECIRDAIAKLKLVCQP